MEILKQKKFGEPVYSFKNKLLRVVWSVVYFLFFRLSPTPCHKYRVMILRLFGAKVGLKCAIYPSCKIWHPSNLSIGDQVAIAPRAVIYNQGNVSIGDRSIVSQGAHICASTHDYNDPIHPLILSSIHINNDVWVCAEAFVCPGINLAKGTVIGARSVITKSTEEWSVYAGNPARKVNIRKRFNNDI